MKILALDTATRTGWAMLAGGVITSGVFDASIRTKATKTIPADHPGRRFDLFSSQLGEFIRENKPELIVYEKIVGGRAAGGNTTLIQKGLEAFVLYHASVGHARTSPIPVWNFAAATIKKWAIGSGVLTHESKIAVCKAAKKEFADQDWLPGKGEFVVDDNQADALWILDLARNVWKETQSGAWASRKFKADGPGDPRLADNLTPIANVVTTRKWATRR